MIVPALLTDKRGKLIEMIKTCVEFTDYVQIDIMDGAFVHSKSVSKKDLKGLSIPIRCEGHLMVADPLGWLKVFKEIGAERIIYHFEIKADQLKIISKIKEMGFKAGIAINPPTKINEFRYLVGEVDMVLFLSVNPGFYGSQFIPAVLEKIKDFKKEYPNKATGIDGGIKLNNLSRIKDTGVNYICVGSAILNSDNPGQEYLKFLND